MKDTKLPRPRKRRSCGEEGAMRWLKLLAVIDGARAHAETLPDGLLTDNEKSLLLEYLDHAIEQVIEGRPVLE